jgi:hypothetical protein
MKPNRERKNANSEKGTTLAAQPIPQVLANAATTFVDSLKLSSVSEKVRRGQQVVLKRRHIYGDQLADLANLYFRMSNIPIRFWSKAEDWRRWEMECFRMLNGDRFRVYPSGAKTICTDKLPGKSLWVHMNRRTLTRSMLEAAGREFFRVHRFWSDHFASPWSHGDATMTNVVYDEKAGRARLIDFELVHHKSLPATVRHADDLLVFLLDILAVAPSRQWLPFALCFLNAYQNIEVIAQLEKQVAVPGGMAWIWWGVRTSFKNPSEVKGRLAKLQDITANLKRYRAVAAKRTRQSRRASMSCHEISPGMPRPISRTLAISDKAKAASPGMPRRLPTKR